MARHGNDFGDRVVLGVVGVSLPALVFLVIQAGTSSLYDTTALPPATAAAPEERSDGPDDPVMEMAAETPAPMSADMGADTPAPAPVESAEPDRDTMTDTATDAPAEDDRVADTAPAPAEDDPVAAAESAPSEPAPSEPASSEPAAPAPDPAPVITRVEGDVDAGERIWRQCSACHVADREQNRVGPHLVDVIGREVAAVEGFRYSDALMDLGGVWTVARLDAWLEDPDAFAPGNRMTYAGLRDAEDRRDVLAYLQSLESAE